MTSQWFYVALFAASIAIVIVAEGRSLLRSMRKFALRPAAAFIGFGAFVSVLFSQRPSLSIFAYGCFIAIIGFGAFADTVFERKRVQAATSFVIALGALVLAVRVLLWRAGEGLDVSAFHIGNNAWLGKLQIAWVLNLMAPFLLVRFFDRRSAVAWGFYALAWLASATAVHYVYSRTGTLAFVLTTFLICATNLRYWRRWLSLLAVMSVCGVIVVSNGAGISERVVASIMRADRDEGIVWRQGVWRATLPMVRDHPLAGIGLGAYDDVAFSQYHFDADPHFFRNGWHAHNVFLHVLAETGIIGLAAWCYLWLAIVVFLIGRWRHGGESERLNSAATLGVVIAFLVLSLTEVLIAARVHASLRMNLTLVLLLVYGCGLASPARGEQTANT